MEEALRARGRRAGSALLRRLLYCGEWIESHVLHVGDAPRARLPGLRERDPHGQGPPASWYSSALRLKKAGNELVALLGGREIHPINVRVGGFYTRARAARARAHCAERLEVARDDALAAARVRWPASSSPTSSATTSSWRCGIPTSTRSTRAGWSRARASTSRAAEYEEHFREEHVPHSNALHSVRRGRGAYHVGPARPLQPELRPPARRASRTPLARRGSRPSCRNPFQSIVVRARRDASSPATRRCASSTPTSRRSARGRGRAARRRRARRAPRRRAASSITATARRRRAHPRGPDRPADRRRTRRRSRTTSASFVPQHLDLPDDELDAALRAGRPQLRPVHLLRDALPEAHAWSGHERTLVHRRRATATAATTERGSSPRGPAQAPSAPRRRSRRERTAGPRDCSTHSRRRRRVILVDAACSGRAPGSILRLRPMAGRSAG